MSHTKVQYAFPILKSAEIISSLDGFEIMSVTEADISKPGPGVTMRIMEALAELFLGYRYGQYGGVFDEDDSRMRDILEEITDAPTLHRDSVPLMAFYRKMSQFFHDIGVHDFGFKDMTAPEPGRMRCMLSAVINFAKFRDHRFAAFEALSQQSEKCTEMHENLLARNAALLNEINAIKQQRAQEEPQVDHLRQRLITLSTELKERKSKGDHSNNELAKLKQQKVDVSDRLANTQQLLANCRADCVRLRSRIVHNPEQLQQAIHDMHASLAALRTENETFESSSRSLQTKLESLTLIEQDLVTCLQLIKECEDENTFLDEASQLLNKANDEVHRKEAEIREVGIKEQQLRRQEISMIEKLSRFQAHVGSKRAAMEKRLSTLRSDWERSGRERSDMQEQLDKYEEVVSETRQMIHKMKSQHEAEVSSIQTDFHRLKQQVVTYIGQMRQGMVASDVAAR